MTPPPPPAEFERDLIRERTLAGLRAARARGHCGGSKPQLTSNQVQLAATLIQDKQNRIKDICTTVGVSRATLYRYVSPNGELRARHRAAAGQPARLSAGGRCDPVQPDR